MSRAAVLALPPWVLVSNSGLLDLSHVFSFKPKISNNSCLTGSLKGGLNNVYKNKQFRIVLINENVQQLKNRTNRGRLETV